MKVGYTVLSEETDEIEASDGIFIFGWWKDRASWEFKVLI